MSSSPHEEKTVLIAAGLASRMRALVLALDRLDRLESGTGSWKAEFEENELPAAAKSLALRGLGVATDPENYEILKMLSEDDSKSLTLMMKESGFGRLVLSERLNDLIQVGFASRLIDTDHAQITASGTAVFQLVEEISSQIQNHFRGQDQWK